MKVRTTAVMFALALVASITFAQTSTKEDCEIDRGRIRSGKTPGPGFNADHPAARVLTFEEFRQIVWKHGTDKRFLPDLNQKTRISPEETTLYEIDNLELVGSGRCNGAVGMSFIRFGDSIVCPKISASIPSIECSKGSVYEQLIANVRSAYFTKISIFRVGEADFAKDCSSGGDETADRTKAIRIIGVGYWDTRLATRPILTIDPVLFMDYMEPTATGDDKCTGLNPLPPADGGGSGGGGTIPGSGGGSGGGNGTGTLGGFPHPGGGILPAVPSSGTEAPATPTPSVFVQAVPDAAEFGNPTLMTDGTAEIPLIVQSANQLEPVRLTAMSDPEGLTFTFRSNTVTANERVNTIVSAKPAPGAVPRDYQVTVTAEAGGQTSTSSFLITLDCNPPMIFGTPGSQPVSQSVQSGKSAALDVKPSGSGPFFYQWYRGSSGQTNFPIANGTGRTFSTPAQTGAESYWVRVTNACGSVDSTTATITTTP